MQGSSNNSFIPKRGNAVGPKRRVMSRQVYVFTLISYVLIFATLLATAGVYLYENYLSSQRSQAITKLHDDIASFSKADMEGVVEFDRYLNQAFGRLNKSVSLLSIFGALEAATIDTVMIDTLSLERNLDENYLLTAAIKTDSFDSTIFQRRMFENNTIVNSVSIDSVGAASTKNQEATQGNQTATADGRSRVSFSAEIEVPLQAIPYVPNAERLRVQSSATGALIIQNGTTTGGASAPAVDLSGTNEISL